MKAAGSSLNDEPKDAVWFASERESSFVCWRGVVFCYLIRQLAIARSWGLLGFKLRNCLSWSSYAPSVMNQAHLSRPGLAATAAPLGKGHNNGRVAVEGPGLGPLGPPLPTTASPGLSVEELRAGLGKRRGAVAKPILLCSRIGVGLGLDMDSATARPLLLRVVHSGWVKIG